jgi:hypothetical protein
MLSMRGRKLELSPFVTKCTSVLSNHTFFCLAVIVLYVLRFPTSGYHFGIFQLCVINIVLCDDGLVSTKSHSNTVNNTQRSTDTMTHMMLFSAKESMIA